MSQQGDFEVCVETSVQAAHRLDEAGQPTDPHPHRWRIAVTVESQELDRIAIVVDFRKLRADMEALLDEIRLGELEQHPELGPEPVAPVAVARWLLDRLGNEYSGETYRVAAVEVGCDPGVSFRVTI